MKRPLLHSFFLVILFVGIGCPLLQAQIVLPIEVLGANGTTQSVTFQVSDASQVKGLWMQVNNLSYADKASVQINQGAYVNLNNSTVVIKGNDKIYGGIGGGFNTIKLTLPLSAGAITNGSNTISFRFNHSDGVSIGYRVIKFNLVDEAGNKILPQATFTEDNPSTWQAPRPAAADIAAGRVLYETGVLIKSPLHSTVTLKAKCLDCHTKHGRDLKYFNYSNRSIIERSKFHGLNQQQGEQIASYIRSLDIAAPGRPWNPPYQPGPGLDAKPVSAWAAGAGLDWVLEDENQALPYLFSNGITSESIATNKTLNVRELPIAMQLLDWKHWLPIVHPKDVWPDWEGSDMNKYYFEARQMLENENGNPALNRDIRNKLEEYAGAQSDFTDSHKPANHHVTIDTATNYYSLKLTMGVKLWEMMHEFSMEDDAQAIYGEKAEHRAWFNHKTRFVFEIAPTLDGAVLFGGNLMNNRYLANVWYHLPLILNAGAGHHSGHHIVDYLYTYGQFGDLANAAGGVEEPIRFMTYLIKGTQVADNGKTGWSGWSFSNASPVWLTWGDTDKKRWNKPAEAEVRKQVTTAYLKTWLEANKRYYPANSPIFNLGDPRNAGDSRWAIPDENYTPSSSKEKEWPDFIMDMIIKTRAWGVDCNVLNDIADWGKQVWPKGDWAALKVTCPPTPLKAVVKLDNAIVNGVQMTVQASTEHMNAKKVEFFVGKEKIGEDTQAPFSITWNNASTGVNQVYAKATDEEGVFVFSNLVPVAVAVAPAYTVSFTIKDVVKGTIKDAVGVLLPGASVTFNGQTVISNASGVATFTNVAVGNGLRYSVSKDGYQQASGTANVAGNLSQTILLSPPTQTVTFIIKDAGGAPLSGALVDLWVQGTLWGQFWKIPSNGSGEAILLNVPQIDGLEYIIKKDGYSDVISLLTVTANLAPQIIVLTAAGIPTYTVSFTVKNAANALLPGARVSFNGQTLTSNASGVATFTVAAGSNRSYSATKTGFNNATGTVNVAANLTQIIVLASTNLTTARTNPVDTGRITARGEVASDGGGKEKAFDDDAKEALGLKLQPNPADHEVSIDLSAFSREQAVQVQISDMTGTLFVNQQVLLSQGEKQVSLPVAQLPQGLFLVRVQASKTAQTAKLIITR